MARGEREGGGICTFSCGGTGQVNGIGIGIGIGSGNTTCAEGRRRNMYVL